AVNLFRFILYPIDGGTQDTYTKLIHLLAVSSDWKLNLTHPWTFITHIFLHEGFWHILWNMLFLYWFGRIVGDLLGDRRVLPVYLLGGLAGGLTYFAMANIPGLPWGVGMYALGASAAVNATLLTAGKTAPDYNIPLLFFGDVKLKYIVVVFLLLDLISLSWNANSGGAFAHLGGAFMGYIIAVQLQNGRDMTAPVSRILQAISSFFTNLFGGQSRPKPAQRNPNRQKQKVSRPASGGSRPSRQSNDTDELSFQEKLDAILDKIKRSGYDSLSAAEKEFLFNASKK
ncbi:MAG: rhomboid family intramembrane serine protease, partial [Bacteroidota bacterium]